MNAYARCSQIFERVTAQFRDESTVALEALQNEECPDTRWVAGHS